MGTEKLHKLCYQPGVVMYVDDYNICRDMEVSPDVSVLHIGEQKKPSKTDPPLLFSLDKRKNYVFPGIKELVIEEGSCGVFVANTMFPNVKRVTSHNQKYLSKHFGFHRSNHFANITLKTIPVDFILKITDTSYRYHYPEYRIITLTIGDRKVFIPNMMDEYDRSKVNAKINEEGVTDNLMYSMYKYAPSEAIRTEIGYHIYNEALKQNNVDKIDEGFRLKLKQRATGMIFHLLDQDRLEEAIMIINLGFLSESMIRGFLKKTDNPAVRAYLLENLHKLDGDGKQMQL